MTNDERPEGVYISADPDLPLGVAGRTVFTKIERVYGDGTLESILLSPINVIFAIDRMREIQMDAEPKTAWCGPESKLREALRQSADGCAQQILAMGLPEKSLLQARDAVFWTLDNAFQRLRCGEWERR